MKDKMIKTSILILLAIIAIFFMAINFSKNSYSLDKSDYKMKCFKVKTFPVINRCENEEVICYTKPLNLECGFKY
jgi:hypothetical protein